MSIFEVNLYTLALTSVCSYLAGALWYSPVLFADTWVKGIGKTHEELGNPGPALAVQVIATVSLAWWIGMLMNMRLADLLPEGLMALSIVGLLSLSAAARLFQGNQWSAVAIDTGYVAVMLLIPAVGFYLFP